MTKETKKILVTGACGQIGSELALKLSELYGKNNVVISDVAEPKPGSAPRRFNF
jgi:L-threonine 3-dehydrogenase (EC 1.1.1.103)